MSLKIAFAGTPEFAAQHLRALLQAEFDLVAVFTQPDRPSGRGNKLQASPVKQVALEQNLPLFQPKTLRNEEIQAQIKSLNLDYLIVVAYGLILPDQVLNAPKFGCINVHASLLPRWRGAAPIQRSILAGDAKTGISLMQMDSGLDTGAVYLQAETSITKEETTSSLTKKLCDLGCDLLINNLQNLHKIEAQIQDENLTNYAEKIEKVEAELDFNLTAEILHRKIRTFEPAWFSRSGEKAGATLERIRVWQAHLLENYNSAKNLPAGSLLELKADGALVACGDNSALLLEKIQLAGGKALHIKDLLNGKKLNWQIGELINA